MKISGRWSVDRKSRPITDRRPLTAMKEYLRPTEFLDFDDQAVREFAERATAGAATDSEKIVRLYYAVRDGFQYNPYILDLRKEGLKASDLLKRSRGYCVEKAILLA